MTSSSASSPARRALEDFVAGRMPADRLVQTLAGRFYGTAGKVGTGEREALRPVMEIVERSAPGVVSLERREGGTGFDVRALERVFPETSLDALRGAAAAALAASWTDPVAAVAPLSSESTTHHTPRTPESWFSRVVSAVKRLFSPSA